uniref:U-scoloptoxin(11)-Sa3a n=1 Tax=Scolopendra alternans TaxID=1329349 RepID=TXB3A_SCOAL|nr:RecName: Full=U-scoloptoxin(11)-Sa3a; Short=U-SLPTX(11)-Sa3a; Flags: Precursor [Scolopendra alternans]
MFQFCLLILLLAPGRFFSALGKPQETLTVENREGSDSKAIPTCREASFCAFLQINPIDSNLDVLPTCTCTGGTTCSHSWDPNDGKSITEGHRQFKFCSNVLDTIKHECSAEEKALTGIFEEDKVTKIHLAYYGFLHCICPDHSDYPENSYNETETVEGDKKIITEYYHCEQFKTCKSDDTCHALAIGETKKIYYKDCNCPEGQTCPFELNSAYKTEYKETTDKFTTYSMRCQ